MYPFPSPVVITVSPPSPFTESIIGYRPFSAIYATGSSVSTSENSRMAYFGPPQGVMLSVRTSYVFMKMILSLRTARKSAKKQSDYFCRVYWLMSLPMARMSLLPLNSKFAFMPLLKNRASSESGISSAKPTVCTAKYWMLE